MNKYYEIGGVSHDVQFGKAGGRIVFANGGFSTISSTTSGSALVPLKVATATDQDHAVTLAAMTAAITAMYGDVQGKITTVTGDVASIQGQLTAMQTTIASVQALAAAPTDVVRARVGSFNEAAGTAAVLSVPASVLLRLKVVIVTPFTAGSTISLKTSTSTLMDATMIDEAQPGVYVIELAESTVDDTLSAVITTSGSGGKAAVTLEFVVVS